MRPVLKSDSGSKRRSRRLALALIGMLAAGTAVASVTAFNHSLDVQIGSGQVCTDGAVFEGTTTAPSSLNLPMTSRVWDGGGTTVIATGNSHTFTMVPETFTFTVMYAPGSVNVGDLVRLSVSDDGTLGGTQGDVVNGTVANCTLAVPSLPVWGALFLILLLIAGGGTLLGRRGRLPAAMD